jgi:uncharacterized membrane protein
MPDESKVAEGLARVLAPAWRRHTDGEQRWPYGLAIGVIIVLQLLLPDRLVLGPGWLLPAVEFGLFVVLAAANPGRLNKRSKPLRVVSMVLLGAVILGTGIALFLLIRDIVSGMDTGSAGHLLATGADVYVINILTFAVWYWEFDRGGPVERAMGQNQHPDFLFPQMTAGDLAPKEWEPQFADYLYLAFTNATAFSPTDVLPFSRWAKLLMLAQSAVALTTAALVVAKAVNALG